jgi:hypothetical protein
MVVDTPAAPPVAFYGGSPTQNRLPSIHTYAPPAAASPPPPTLGPGVAFDRPVEPKISSPRQFVQGAGEFGSDESGSSDGRRGS